MRRTTISSKKRTQKILEAALQLFTQQGLRKTTIEQIAAAAEIGKGTIYLSFKSKDDILCALVQQEIHWFLRTLRSAIRKEQTAVEQLRTYILTSIQTAVELQVARRISHELREESLCFLDKVKHEHFAVERSIIENILEFGSEQDEFVIADISLASQTIVIIVHSMRAPWLYPGYEAGLHEKAEELADMILDGLRWREPKGA